MASGVQGVNHVACLAQNMDETVRFYERFLDIKVRRIANDEPGHKHYCLDLGRGGTLDFFEATPGTEATVKDRVGGLNHLALSAEPDFIDEAHRRLSDGKVDVRVTERAGDKTIYFSDPNGITLQLYPVAGGSRG
jgi:glyoxylase I family protein